jgi:hypothetical protein
LSTTLGFGHSDKIQIPIIKKKLKKQPRLHGRFELLQGTSPVSSLSRSASSSLELATFLGYNRASGRAHHFGIPFLLPTYRHRQSQKNGLGTARRTPNCQDAWSSLRCHKWLAPRVDHSESAQSWLMGECPKLTRKAISHGPSNS